jgi:hypothetical protein
MDNGSKERKILKVGKEKIKEEYELEETRKKVNAT